MGYQVERNVKRRRKYGAGCRLAEFQEMVDELAKDPDVLTAKTDIHVSSVYKYAKQLNVQVGAKLIDKKHSYVWLKTSRDMQRVVNDLRLDNPEATDDLQ